jgi:hypothetical protein
LAVAALLVVIAVRQFRGRPAPGDEVPLPAWMGAIDGVRPLTATGLGALLAGLNPKNLLLAVAAALAIAQTGVAAGQQAAAYAVFAVMGSLGVAIPLAIYVAGGDRAPTMLGRLKEWLGLHNKALIAAKLVGDALPALTI